MPVQWSAPQDIPDPITPWGMSERRMYLSLNRVTVGGQLAWPELAALAGRTGYPAVDVDIDTVRQLGASRTRDLLSVHKLRPGVCDLPTEFRRDDATFRASLRELGELAGLAAQIGCPRMVTWVPPAYETPGREMRSILQRRFTEMGKVAAAHGVRLGMEFISPQHFRDAVTPDRVCVWQMADMLDLCISAGENVGLLLDSWHWHHDPDATVDTIVSAGRQRIVHVHLNDAADLPPGQVRDDERLLPGEGVIRLNEFVGALRQIGYVDAVSPEIFGRFSNLSPEDAARQALDASRRVLA